MTLEEVKTKYPIGTTFKVISDYKDAKIGDIVKLTGYPNEFTTWAKFTNDKYTNICLNLPHFYEPEVELYNVNEFVKGDYIVCLDTPEKDTSFPKNYIFKQRENGDYLLSELDVGGSKTNGWCLINYNKKSISTTPSYNWRYATPEEIAEYNRLGKPYDVTTLNKVKSEPVKEESTSFPDNISSEINMKEIQAEAKRRFPIGCKFKSISGHTYELIQDGSVYSIHGSSIWASSGYGLLYESGKWAELLEECKSSEPVEEELKEGDWVICIGEEDTCKYGTSSGWEKGLVYQINWIDNYYNHKILFGGKDGNGVYLTEGHLRKATESEINAYKQQSINNITHETIESELEEYQPLQKQSIAKKAQIKSLLTI